MKDLIDSAAKLVAIGTAAALCFSFVYNATYFWTTGASAYMELLTLGDHLAIAIRVVPLVGLSALVGAVPVFVAMKHEVARNVAPATPMRSNRFLASEYFGILYLIVMLGMAIWLESWRFWVGSAIFFVPMIALRVYNHRAQNSLSPQANWILLATGWWLFAAVAWGLLLGEGQIRSNLNVVIYTRNGVQFSGVSFFAGERGHLITVPDPRRMVFIPRDTIQRQEAIPPAELDRFCGWWRLCLARSFWLSQGLK